MAEILKTDEIPISSYVSHSGHRILNSSNPVGSTSSSSYAQLEAHPDAGKTSYMYYKFDVSDIPSTAVIGAITCKVLVGDGYQSGEIDSYSIPTVSLCSGSTKLSEKQMLEARDSAYAEEIKLVSKCTISQMNDLRLKVEITCNEDVTYGAYLYLYYATIEVSYALPSVVGPVDAKVVIDSEQKPIATSYFWRSDYWCPIVESYACINGKWVSTSQLESINLYTWRVYESVYTNILDITWNTSTFTITMDSNKQWGTQEVYFCGESRLYVSDGNIVSDGRDQQEVYEFSSSWTDPGVDGQGLILIVEGGTSTSYDKVLSYTRDYTDDTVTFTCVSMSSWTATEGYSYGHLLGAVISEDPNAYSVKEYEQWSQEYSDYVFYEKIS